MDPRRFMAFLNGLTGTLRLPHSALAMLTSPNASWSGSGKRARVLRGWGVLRQLLRSLFIKSFVTY